MTLSADCFIVFDFYNEFILLILRFCEKEEQVMYPQSKVVIPHFPYLLSGCLYIYDFVYKHNLRIVTIVALIRR